jgi:hypothetical protein
MICIVKIEIHKASTEYTVVIEIQRKLECVCLIL